MTGEKRVGQRFEQCLIFFRSFMQPALEAMQAATFYDESVHKSATELVKLAVAEFIEEIDKNEDLSVEKKYFVIEKLKSAKVWVMFPDDILNLTKIERLYDELDFEGSESLDELSTKIDIHYRRSRLQPHDNWVHILYTVIYQERVTYFPDLNILSEYAICCL